MGSQVKDCMGSQVTGAPPERRDSSGCNHKPRSKATQASASSPRTRVGYSSSGHVMEMQAFGSDEAGSTRLMNAGTPRQLGGCVPTNAQCWRRALTDASKMLQRRRSARNTYNAHVDSTRQPQPPPTQAACTIQDSLPLPGGAAAVSVRRPSSSSDATSTPAASRASCGWDGPTRACRARSMCGFQLPSPPLL
jgi:hypothetical protein